MEAHSSRNSVMGKKLWNFLRIAYYMMRKGLMSKRKLIMDMDLMMKGGKTIRKSLVNLMTFHSHRHHQHSSNDITRGSFGGAQDYEFSCSNSPNPVFFHMSKRKHHYFPCINPPNEEDVGEIYEETTNKAGVLVRPKIGYSPECAYNFQFSTTATPDLAPGDNKFIPLLSPFAVRVTDYSSEDESEIQLEGMSSNPKVDDEAEDFIQRFYEQLRLQSKTRLLQYQENQYKEMLARGTC